MGPPDSDGVSRVPAYLGSRWAGGGLRARGCHPLRPAFPGRCARRPPCRAPVPLPRRAGPAVWASSAFARRYWRNHSCLLFLRLLRCFTSPGVAHPALFHSGGGAPLAGGGLPHSDTPGSKAACASPGLFAACRVLHRLPPPRHPPRARAAWAPERRQAGPACSEAPKGASCLTKKRRCAALGPRTPFQGEMSLPPAHKGAGDVLYLAGGRANPRP